MTDATVNNRRRRFLTTAATVVGGAGLVASAVPFIAAMKPSARTRAIGAPVEVDVGALKPGEKMTVQWQGKPVWIVRRSQESIEALASLVDELRDPESQVEQQPPYARNEYRSRKPEFLVVIGLCTHLGCSPTYLPPDAPHDFGPGWKGGFNCPCHGSRFDLAGRVYKGVPAPSNLVVPPYKFVGKTRILIGDDSGAAV